MSYLTAATRTRGYTMDDRKPSAVKRTHNFVTAETYLRERPLRASLRSMADFTSAYYLNGKRTMEILT
jgi:hypothetical protein